MVMGDFDVTVVIPHLPWRTKLLERALDSVITQTRTATDVIIELAGPGDDAATVRNRALDAVHTPWIAWLDDDDELLPDHLQVCLDAARATSADLVYPGMEIVGRDDPLAVSVGGKWINPFGVTFGQEQEMHLRNEGNFIPVTYVVRTELVRRAGGFPHPTQRVPEDHGLLIRLLDIGARFHHVPVRTWRYHVHDANTGGVSEDLRLPS
jgi:glycosyltransferase involved in cell wall biosynthesis